MAFLIFIIALAFQRARAPPRHAAPVIEATTEPAEPASRVADESAALRAREQIADMPGH